MDHTNFNTEEIIRKPGKHLTSDERGKIEVMRKVSISLRNASISASLATVLMKDLLLLPRKQNSATGKLILL